MTLNRTRTLALCAVLACTALTGFADAQTKPDTGPKPSAGQRPVPPMAQRGDIKPYTEVITDKAKTQEGLFKVHRIDDKVYWEIPAKLFGRDLLWQTEVAEFPQNTGYPGQSLGYKIVQFSRHDKKVYMRAPGYEMRAVNSAALEAGVEASSVSPIIQSFNIEAEGKDKSVVIDVTGVFQMDQTELAVGPRVGAAGVDPSRSYIDRITAFPNNIETRAYLTLGVMSGGGGRSRATTSSVTILVHSSLVLLPETPMMGRYSDSRVGYFASGFDLYGGNKNKAEYKEYINRFRLEKKDPTKAISDPVKPIVFYTAREVPEIYRASIKKAVEAWQPAFEQAGFSNAIICKEAPSEKEDPTWDPEDARYSVIRWAPSPNENAMGPHISDPRSGETISAHVIVWHNVLELAEDWYFSQAAATDPRAAHLPLPNDVMGDLVQFIVTHEVGHTLGLEHNFKGSSAYTTKQLRDAKFTKENGLAASVMDYARFNYVAQPGDGAATIGKLGPYDKFAIEWGYKPIPATKPEDEKSTLDAIAARQVGDKTLRFDNDFAAFRGVDPSAQTEDLGDDPIEATRLGLKNIKRIAGMLVPASTKFGEDYDDLLSAYSSLLFQRSLELRHVAKLVGGVVTTDYHAGRGADTYAPVPAAKQAEAVKFLMENMTMPSELLNPAVLNKVTDSGALNVASSLETVLLQQLLSPGKIARLQDNEALNGSSVYTVSKLIPDVTNGVWSEIFSAKPKIDVYRRSLQLSFLDMMDSKINQGGTSEVKNISAHALQVLAKKIDAALPKVKDEATAVHLSASRKTIEKILAGKSASASGGGGPIYLIFGADGDKPDSACFDAPGLDAIKHLIKGDSEK